MANQHDQEFEGASLFVRQVPAWHDARRYDNFAAARDSDGALAEDRTWPRSSQTVNFPLNTF